MLIGISLDISWYSILEGGAVKWFEGNRRIATAACRVSCLGESGRDRQYEARNGTVLFLIFISNLIGSLDSN